MDVMRGEEVIDATFRFRETTAVNDQFELFGFGDKNFMLNSGSYLLIVLGLIAYFFTRWVVNKLAVKFSHHQKARQIGMWAYEPNTLRSMSTAFKKLFLESYFDLLFCTFINVLALQHALQMGLTTALYFTRFDDRLNTVVTLFHLLSVFIFPVYVAYTILANFDQLDTKKVTETHGIFYDGCHTKTRGQALYNVLFMLRRLLTVLVLIFIREVPFF
jgi:hypothetical protein